MWVKYPDEVTIEGADWTEILGNDTLSGDVVMTPIGTLTDFSVEVLDTIENISRIRLTGGAAGESGYLIATLVTAGGQTLKPSNPVQIRRRNPTGEE